MSMTSDDRSPATRDGSPAERSRSAVAALLMIVATLLLAPFAGTRLPKYQAFFPVFQTAVILAYLLTAWLVMALYQATRLRSLLPLGAGSLYTAGVLLLQLLAYPGAFTAAGPLLGGPQSMIWLWFFWHVGPTACVLLFAHAEMQAPGARSERPQRDVRRAFGLMALALAVTGLWTTGFPESLPVLDHDGDFAAINTTGLAPALELLLALALFALWRMGRFAKVLQLWLALGLLALLCDNAITMLGTSRQSLGWYAGRSIALVSALLLPLLYLREIRRAYVRAATRVVQLSEENAGLSRQVYRGRHDPLTGLPSRALFMELAQALRQRAVQGEHGFATLFIDLDGFKAINDTHGHQRGDEVLQKVAAILQAELRGTDSAGRLGGDEFAVCLEAPLGATHAVAAKVAARIIDKISSLGDGIGASIGISFSRDGVALALAEADEAMYRAKKSGKNRCSVHRAAPRLVLASTGEAVAPIDISLRAHRQGQ